MSSPLTAEDIQQFHDDGFVRLPGAFDRDAALGMQDFIWKYLGEKQGIRHDDRNTWVPALKLNKTTHYRVYDAVGTDRLFSAVDQVLGSGTWNKPKGWGQFLVTFPPPHPPHWTVTHVNWHWDGNCWDHLKQANGVFLFTFYSSVQPQGGGTLVASGTHRLLAKFIQSLPDARKYPHSQLRQKFWPSHPWLTALSHQSHDGEDLVAPFMDCETDIDGIPVRVVELTGEPGDAVLCHPSIMHAASMNCAAVPRSMRAGTINPSKPPAGTSAPTAPLT